MLSQLPRNARQVLSRPCKDVPILTEEVDELAFLFVGQAGTDNDSPVGDLVIDLDLLRLLGGLEGDTTKRVGHSRHIDLRRLSQSHGALHFFLLLGNDQRLGQSGASRNTLHRTFVVAGNGYDTIRSRQLHFEVADVS